MKPVLEINEVVKPRHVSRWSYLWLFLMTAWPAAVFTHRAVVVAVPLGASLWWDLWVVANMALVIGVTLPQVLRGERAFRGDEATYREYLRGVDLSTLKCAAMSPEIRPYSRRLIRAFLKDNHPGWSFSHVAGPARPAG
jgi:hypothetical protein